MTVAEIMRVDEPTGDVTWTLGQTLAALEQPTSTAWR